MFYRIIMKTDKKSLARERALKKIPFDAMNVSDINFLEKRYIINGIWPESYWPILRWLMTKLFSMLSYKRHDINFRQQSGFHKANWGLLKYSFLSLADEYRKITKRKWYKKIYQVPKYLITLPFKAIIIVLAYSAVESPAWKRAYDALKD